MLLPTPACPAPSSYVAGWHTVVQLVRAPCLSSWPQRFAAALRTSIAAARLLLLIIAEIVSFILALCSYSYHMIRTSPSVTVRDESITAALETDGVSEGP